MRMMEKMKGDVLVSIMSASPALIGGKYPAFVSEHWSLSAGEVT